METPAAGVPDVSSAVGQRQTQTSRQPPHPAHSEWLPASIPDMQGVPARSGSSPGGTRGRTGVWQQAGPEPAPAPAPGQLQVRQDLPDVSAPGQHAQAMAYTADQVAWPALPPHGE